MPLGIAELLRLSQPIPSDRHQRELSLMLTPVIRTYRCIAAKAINPMRASGLWPIPLMIAISLLTSCSVVSSLPGWDRLIHPESSAEVGPLLTDANDQPVKLAEQERIIVAETPPDIIAPETPAKASTVETLPAAEPPMTTVTSDPPKALSQAPSSSTTDPVSATHAPSNISAEPEPESAKPKSEPATPDATVIPYGQLTGRVELQDNGTPQPLTGDTFITLHPQFVMLTAEAQAPVVHEIDMEKKTYLPGALAINRSDQVVFVNKDKIRHNVFSSSGQNAFDLGTYGAGLKRAVTLKENGVVKVYCNIHADMATFIAVGEPGLSTRVNAQGFFNMPQLIPGKYRLHTWNIRGEVWQDIDIKAEQILEQHITVDISRMDAKAHQNKFGKKYPKNAALFEDEFY